MTDPVADMLTQIRNATMVHQNQVSVPYSKLKAAVAQILVDKNFLNSTTTEGKGLDQVLQIVINDEGQPPRLTHIKRLSRSGRRLYCNASQIPVVRRGRGLVVISTSQGLMDGSTARQRNLGGELICEVY